MHRPLTSVLSGSRAHLTRFYHKKVLSNGAVQRKRSEMFDVEARRQAALITDVEKIEVQYQDLPEHCTLIMNKRLSTPHNCAQHINQTMVERAVLAEVDGQVWDMHRPLEGDCTLRFLHFRQPDPYYVNKAFWRSASVMLGAVLESCFKDDLYVEVCSFPSPNVRSGSFVYDVDLKIPSWEPTKEELRTLSGEMVKLAMQNLRFERLEVDAALALRIFEDNQYKKRQVPLIAAQSTTGNTVTVYRVGQYVDLSRGPLVGSTGHLGKVTVAGVHAIDTQEGRLFRVQGVALPKGFMLNHFSYGLLEDRAARLNPGRFPSISTLDTAPQAQAQPAH